MKRICCASILAILCVHGSAPGAAYSKVLIKGVPHVKQRPDFCGEACAEMMLRKLKHDVGQDEVFNQAQLNPVLGRGCWTRELAPALKRIGFETGPVWYQISAEKSEKQIEAQWKALHADLVRGVGSIVCMYYDDRPKTTEHFRLVLGYDPKRDEVIYHEPAIEKGAYKRMKRALFQKLWPLKYGRDRWTLIRMRLDPKKIKKPRSTPGFTSADYAQHILQLKKKIPSRDFTIVLQPPFVVIGDEPANKVRARASGTVKWAADKLKKDYFKKDPEHILDVWLFKNKTSYEKHTREIFRDRPGTPYGYYSPQHRALIMNIATGGGTLVHEIVHPFIESNFPACPAWFNEGLASLYEQCREKDGKIYGMVNWRLPGLQKAIRANRLPSFKKTTGTTEREFRNEDPGTNYSQSRYLCYHLQEKKLLRKYYHAFVKNHKKDPTGYKTLKAVLGETDMDFFQGTWEREMLKLRY